MPDKPPPITQGHNYRPKDEKIIALVTAVVAPIDARLKVLEAIIGPVDHPALKAMITEAITGVIAPIDVRIKALEAIVGPQD